MKKHLLNKKFLYGLVVLFFIILVFTWYSVRSMPVVVNLKTPQPAKLNYRFGLSVSQSLLYNLTDNELNSRLDDIASMNIGWLRFDIDWSSVQPSGPDYYDWSEIDRLVAGANVRNIKLLPIIDNVPAWARISGCHTAWCPPADDNTFANFVSTVVRRYSSKGITTWEIWNEPNMRGFWKPVPNPGAYAELLRAVFLVIKKQESSATVILGGLGSADPDYGDIYAAGFLSSIYKAGAGPYFDAVAFHPYSYPGEPSSDFPRNSWPQMLQTGSGLLSVMASNGDSYKKIWLTEFGAPTGGPDSVTEDGQASIIQDAVGLWRNYDWAGPLFVYTYKDSGTNPNTNENFFGLLRYNGTQKPAYNLLKNFATTVK